MAGSRTLKLSILADVDDLKKKLSDGENGVDNFGSKFDGFGAKVGAAFAVAGAAAAAYAGKLLVDGVQAAIEDEKAQARLAGTLERAAGASQAQVKAVEDYISKTSLATGVTDDQLRPAFERLTLSTKNVTETQKLLPLAMDISAATGKSLDTVVNGLAKAYDGNTGALNKLGLGFEAADIKGKSLNDLLPQLQDKFGGAAQEQADTFAGKIDRLKNAFGEAQETVGSFILDAITPLVSNFVDYVIPTISNIANEIGQNLKPVFEDISAFISDVWLPAFKSIWSFIGQTLIPLFQGTFSEALKGIQNVFGVLSEKISANKDNFKKFFDAVQPIISWLAEKVAPLMKGYVKVAFDVLATSIGVLVDIFGKLAGAIGSAVNGIQRMIDLIKNNPVVKGISGIIDNVFGGGRAEGGSVFAGTPYIVGEKGAELFVPTANGTIIPNKALGSGGTVINLSVSGAIDAESTARQIVNILNQSFARGTGGAAALNF